MPAVAIFRELMYDIEYDGSRQPKSISSNGDLSQLSRFGAVGLAGVAKLVATA
jgi:hypothetical protein